VIQFFQWFAAENRKHYFRFLIIKNRRYDLLKIFYECVILISEPSSNLENRMTVCMEYPAMISQERAGKRRWKGAGTPCRENGVRTMIFHFISERMVCL